MAPKQQVTHPAPSSIIRDSREAIAQTPRRVSRARSRVPSPDDSSIPPAVSNKPFSPGWSKAVQNIRASSSPLTSLRRSTRSPSVTPKTPNVGLPPIPGPSQNLPSQIVPDSEPFRHSSLEYEDGGSSSGESEQEYMEGLPPSQPKPPLITNIQENLDYVSGTIQGTWTEGVTGPRLVFAEVTRKRYSQSQPPSPTGEEPGDRFGRETTIVLKDIVRSLDYLVLENNKRGADLYSANTNIFEIGNTFVELTKMFGEGEVHEALRELRRQQVESEDRILNAFRSSEGKFSDLKDTISLLIQRVNNLDQKVTSMVNNRFIGGQPQPSPPSAPAVVKPPPLPLLPMLRSPGSFSATWKSPRNVPRGSKNNSRSSRPPPLKN